MNKEYFEIQRLDVLELIPKESQKILECGCAFGWLGTELKKRQQTVVVGIELNPEAEQYLNFSYDKYYIGDIENIDLSEYNNYFDCIIYADILEHLVDPWKLVKQHSYMLKKGGVIIVSIPNVRNIILFKELFIYGRWKYQDSGLFDKTHLRFFTIKDSIELLKDANLRIDLIKSNPDKYSFLFSTFAFIPNLINPELKVCQWLIRAVK